MSFPEHLKTAIGGGNILLYAGPVDGEGDGGGDQMLIMATENSSERLRTSRVWLSDGPSVRVQTPSSSCMSCSAS